MRDEEIEEFPDLPVDDATSVLDEIGAGEDSAVIPELPPTGPPLSRREIDDLVDRVLNDELKRLNDPTKKRG
ncbi:MAG: hypothetical protein ACJ75H_07475 [Thermoanaerobaculia bacterium]